MTTTRTTRKPRGDGYERRPEILEAARGVFNERGYDQTTMRRVAQRAKVSTAGIYIYFENKEAILAAIRDQTFLDLDRFMQAAVSQMSDPAERLRVHLRSYLDFAQTNPDAYRLTFSSRLIRAPRPGRPSSAGEAAGRKAFTALVDEIVTLIKPATPEASNHDTAHVLAEAAWAAIHGLTSLVIDVPGFPASGLEPAFNELVHMVLSGIHARVFSSLEL